MFHSAKMYLERLPPFKFFTTLETLAIKVLVQKAAHN